MTKEETAAVAAEKPVKKEPARVALLRGCEKASGELVTVKREQLIEALKS